MKANPLINLVDKSDATRTNLTINNLSRLQEVRNFDESLGPNASPGEDG